MTHTTLSHYIAEELSLPHESIGTCLQLFDEGATIPFIARYRKERTQGLNEIELRKIQIRYTYYNALNERKATVLKHIEEQGKLTQDLKNKIESCRDKQQLEDTYLPYKKRRQTKADIAIKNGLEPLAKLLLKQSETGTKKEILAPYISDTGPITNQDEALEGARHIIAQNISDTPEYRRYVRDHTQKKGVLESSVTTPFKTQKTKFDMYDNFKEPLQKLASHRILAIRRGEKEKVLKWKILINDDLIYDFLCSKLIRNQQFIFIQDLYLAIQTAYKKSIYPAVQTECFNELCADAEEQSIDVFSKNLHNLLLTAPAGNKMIMGIDPGFRTGCKLAVIDKTGHYQCHNTIFPVPPHQNIKESTDIILDLVARYKIELIAIGNGTGGKETFQFIKTLIKEQNLTLTPVIVNEAGASVYSASELAIQEYPDLDITIRGAISIAHRLQDPLSELVKIDPKSIGVGQYQHDVKQTQLKEALTFTTELAVNTVGVDVNTASSALLSYVSGIGPNIATNIVNYRKENGPFKNRQSLLKVPKLGKKAFEQCAGFLRLKTSKNPLDNSAIHPESYPLVETIASQCNCSIPDLIGNAPKINTLNLDDYVTDTVGIPTLTDIVKELLKPGLDPRAEFSYANFDDTIDEIDDLKIGMTLEGVVTNVTNFGAFVDIGVHQDGLIHISKLSDQFVKNPHDIIAVGDRVKTTVEHIDLDLKRIQLARVLDA